MAVEQLYAQCLVGWAASPNVGWSLFDQESGDARQARARTPCLVSTTRMFARMNV